MSFSDFGGGPSYRAKVSSNNSKTQNNNNSINNSINGNGAAVATPATGSLAVISETLLQYQRNVGILEGIVQSLQSSAGTALEQYEAQNHVLEQLQDKIQNLLRQAPKQHTAVIKLSRDFQKIKLRATQLQDIATRRLTQKSSVLPLSESSSSQQQRSSSFGDAANSNVSYQQQQQLQLMEDRLHEQLMREREDEIRNINQGMHTVNEIYKDLAHIVSEQQEGIDQIETQMEDSRANAEQGLKQVELANEKFGNANCQIM